MKKDILQQLLNVRDYLDEIIKQLATTDEVPDSGPSFPESPEDALFHNALELPKVKAGLYAILHLKDEKGNPLFRHQKLWYVVHRLFDEMDWLEDRKHTRFRRWAESVYGKQGHSTKGDWDGVSRYYKEKPSKEWEAVYESDHTYVELARAMWQKFQGADGKNEGLFVKPDRFIWHKNRPRR